MKTIAAAETISKLNPDFEIETALGHIGAYLGGGDESGPVTLERAAIALNSLYIHIARLQLQVATLDAANARADDLEARVKQMFDPCDKEGRATLYVTLLRSYPHDELLSLCKRLMPLPFVRLEAVERERDDLRALLPKWIPVSERLPDEYETVLIWREGIPVEVGAITAFWTGEKWCRDVMKESFEVTHWQKRPTPPDFNTILAAAKKRAEVSDAE